MSDDATLDEFLGGEEPEEPEETASSDGEESDAEQSVDPVTSTYAWSPDGGTCADCGERAETRWRDDDGLVCADCKEW